MTIRKLLLLALLALVPNLANGQSLTFGQFVSGLPSISAPDAGDSLYILHNGLSSRISASSFFSVTSVMTSIVRSITSGDSVQPTDCGTTLILGTGSTGQFTLTLPSVSGFAASCFIAIKNADTTNGKILSGFPSDLFPILWPGQTVMMRIINGVWVTFENPGSWYPQGSVTLYASPGSTGTQDCLTSTTACTLADVCQARNKIDTGISGPIAIQLEAGLYSGAVDIYGAMCSINGNQGGGSSALTNITGDCIDPTNVVILIPNSGIGFFAKDAGEVTIQCVELGGGTSIIGFFAAQFAVIDLANIYFGTFLAGSIGVYATQSASINMDVGGTFKLASSFVGAAVINIASNANLAMQGSAWEITSAIGVTYFLVNQGGYVNATAPTFTGAGVAGSGGIKYFQGGGGCIYTGGVHPNSVFPGSTNLALPVNTCGDFSPASNLSTMPACNAGTEGRLYAITDSNVSTFGATISGTGANHVMAYCDGTNLTVR